MPCSVWYRYNNRCTKCCYHQVFCFCHKVKVTSNQIEWLSTHSLLTALSSVCQSAVFGSVKIDNKFTSKTLTHTLHVNKNHVHLVHVTRYYASLLQPPSWCLSHCAIRKARWVYGFTLEKIGKICKWQLE